MGGRIRLTLAGGAPLSPDTHEQIKLCLCTDLIQGYGLTETTSGATVMDSKYKSSNQSINRSIQLFLTIKYSIRLNIY